MNIVRNIALLAYLVTLSGYVVPRTFTDENIRYEPVNLTAEEKKIVAKLLANSHSQYDPKEKMLAKKLGAWNYHTDAETGTFHDVRSSLNYASGLLDMADEKYTQRAFDIIEKTISLQDTLSTSRSRGVWPYYQEEPLATKKSPIDYNWADFNAATLLDIYMGHKDRLPATLQEKIRQALILAANAIRKRDVQPGYTNIAIMGTYVTYVTSHLFDLPEMQEYAANRLNKFYNYTLERGFTEYNSPAYTIVALDELDRMKRHIVAKDSKPKIDSLYAIGWNIVARHYHQPSGQWAGPHSRSYNSLATPSFYGILKQASGGKINLPGATDRNDLKIKHIIPSYLLPYFLSPVFPRTERDSLVKEDPAIIGTTYLTKEYALSTASRSSLWNQRRPFLAYWGTEARPYYLQVRMLRDFYDFSSASFYGDQKGNNVLAAVTFITDGGNKHISIDKLKDGKFKAKDLRLRFEIGNHTSLETLTLPQQEDSPIRFTLDNIPFNLQLFISSFAHQKGHWEKGSDKKGAWLDYVIYNGIENEFDLSKMDQAILAFTFDMGSQDKKGKRRTPTFELKNDNTDLFWENLKLSVPSKPVPQPKNL
jgi:hypothetical protein